MWSPPSPESPFSPLSDSDMHSPYTMHTMLDDEEAEIKAAIEAEKRFREEHGFSALPGEIVAEKRLRKKAEKKDGHREAAHEYIPPQSPVYEYGASESSDEERGPSVVDQPPAAIDIEMAEANVVNEDDSGNQDDSDSDNADDADSDDSDDSDEDFEGSDASEVTS